MAENDTSVTLSELDVKKICQKLIDNIEIPSYEEQIAKLTTELNETRESLNKANDTISEITKKINEFIEKTDLKITELATPKKSFLDEVILPE